MSTLLLWITASGILMSAIALSGSLVLVLSEKTQQKLLLPMVALAAGSLLGGALFHMLPAAVEALGDSLEPYLYVALGFLSFFVLEQFLHWHHCHHASTEHHAAVSYLVLIADGVHNFIGGLAVASAFIADIRLGIVTWVAAAAHEVPQEIGDFGVLRHAGWPKRRALLFNLLSGLTFLIGGWVAYAAATTIDVSFLLALGAGNFIYIAAADLVPQINRHETIAINALHFVAFCIGLGALAAVHWLPHGH